MLSEWRKANHLRPKDKNDPHAATPRPAQAQSQLGWPPPLQPQRLEAPPLRHLRRQHQRARRAGRRSRRALCRAWTTSTRAALHIRRWGKGSDVIGTKLRFRKGDIIFGRRRAYQRKLAVAEMDGICSAHAMVVGARSGVVLTEFLPFLMMSDRFMNRAVEISVGSLSPTINWTTLKHEPFTLPPLDQQRRIAEILWAVDEVNEKYEALIADLTNSRRAQIDGLIPAPENASKKMNFIRLDEVASMQNGRPFPSGEYQESGVRLIRPGNLAPDGSLDWSPSATACLPERQRDQEPGLADWAKPSAHQSDSSVVGRTVSSDELVSPGRTTRAS